MAKEFLNDVYALKSVDDMRALYDDWSATYDEEVGGKGYATPARVALALAGLMADRSAPILDFGCGTGMSGAAMKAQGFSVIDGCDLSGEMLARAREKQAYRRLWQANTDGPFPARPGDYAAITAVGVVSIGAAPPETLDVLVGALAPGALLAFSFYDRTFEDPRFEARVTDYLTTGTCTQLFREDGEHLPGIGLRSTVFVLRCT
ncbi:MAG: class I SAM-dependent DNA methyltransferase [Paracoccaceae bacterium]